MRYLGAILLITVSNLVICQTIDFSAYDNISNANFQAYVNLFPNATLPIDSDQLRVSNSLDLSIKNISSSVTEEFLKSNGEYIVPKLYTYVSEDDTRTDMFGKFQPVYKLPTNGNYILLVVYQFDGQSEQTNKVLILSYDLAGNFIKTVGNGYLMSGMENEVNCSIDESLVITHTYLPNIGKSYDERWACKPCATNSQTDIYQVTVTGQDTLESSTNNETGNFHYTGTYFKQE